MIAIEATCTRGRQATEGPPQLEPASATGHELVHGALGRPSRDELAQQDICAALLSTPGLDARRIEVEMTAAGVLLRGTVAGPDDRAWALRIAKRIAAPRPVREALSVLSDGAERGPRASARLEAADAQ
jgi:osmotically-inducible protein OsmY